MNTPTVSRDELRAKLLGNAPAPDRKAITLFGMEIELVQPSFKSILNARETEAADVRSVQMIIDYAYVPGTDEKIFEEGDVEVILSWPFTEDLVEVNKAIAELTGINIAEAEKEIQADPLDER